MFTPYSFCPRNRVCKDMVRVTKIFNEYSWKISQVYDWQKKKKDVNPKSL